MDVVVIPCESEIKLIRTESADIHLTLKTHARREGKQVERSKRLGVAPANVVQSKNVMICLGLRTESQSRACLHMSHIIYRRKMTSEPIGSTAMTSPASTASN
jgi:hypothetical protein